MADEKIERTALTWKQIQAEIAERSDAEIEELPRTQHAVWVSRFTSMDVQTKLTLKSAGPEWAKLTDKQKTDELNGMMSELIPMTITRGKPWPANPNYVVAEIFRDTDEVRVYAVPASATTEPVIAAMLYSINRSCPLPTFTVDALWIDVWIDAIVQEWDDVDGETNPEEAGMEAERETTIAYLKTLKEGYRIADLLADIQDGTHLEVEPDDDDDEDETKEPDETANGAAAAAETPNSEPAATEVTTPAPAS
jgi:hypothetical protein